VLADSDHFKDSRNERRSSSNWESRPDRTIGRPEFWLAFSGSALRVRAVSGAIAASIPLRPDFRQYRQQCDITSGCLDIKDFNSKN
jgi:hypothetical protein